jgi:transcriptional regulator with XRE-family HTH domain
LAAAVLGWRGTQLATRIGIAPSTLNNIEAERRSASPHLLTLIAQALNIPTQTITRPRDT